MLDVSDATPPSAERLVTHRLLESVLPQPILVMLDDDVSTVDSDDIDDDTVVEHIDDGGQETSNFELSNSNSCCLCSSSSLAAATGHILLELGWLGKDSGGGGRLLLLLPHSVSIIIIFCCSWNDRRELLLMFIVTAGCIRYVVKFMKAASGACSGVLLCRVELAWERLNSHSKVEPRKPNQRGYKALRLSPSGTYPGIIMSTKRLRRANKQLRRHFTSSMVFFEGRRSTEWRHMIQVYVRLRQSSRRH